MLELGIDEFTLVLQLAPRLKAQINPFDWRQIAENLIYTFVERSDFLKIFGTSHLEMRVPQGYTVAYTYGEHNFYLAVAYHEDQINMGVAIKFSAQALDYYCEQSGLKVYEFLQTIQDKFYTTRLSRIDLTADYIDENIDVTMIYQNLMDNRIAVFREYISKKTGATAYLKCSMQYQGFLKGQEVPTIYLGSAQSNSRLRVYDKKREQMERNGSKLNKAKSCNNWVRFEGVFRNEFAHQIGDALLKIGTDMEFSNLIACTMVQKFRMMYVNDGVVDCDTEYTQMLLDVISNKTFILKSPSSRNYELLKNLRHLFYGSGVINTLYKIKEIWGNEAVSKLLKFIDDYLDEFEPNDDCRYWLRKNTHDYRKNFSDFDTFMRDTISPIL